MISEKELTKRLMASVEIEMPIPPYQLGVLANLIVALALLLKVLRNYQGRRFVLPVVNTL